MATKHSIAGIKGIRLGVCFFLACACWTILIVVICLFDFCADYATDCEIAQITISKGLGKDLLDSQWTPYQKSIDNQRQILLKSYGTIWLAGMAGISLFLYRIKVYLAKLKLAKNAIGEYELLERALMASLPIGIAVIDPKTRVIERINGYGAGLFGAPAEQIAGHRCHKFVCPADEKSCPICDLGAVVDNSEKTLLCADGSQLPVLKSVKRFHLNGKEKLLETFVDISPLKKAEKAVAESDARYWLLFEKSPDAYLTVENGQITGCNEAAIRISNIPYEQLVGKSPAELLPECQPDGTPSADIIEAQICEVMETGEARFELKLTRPDGVEKWVDISLAVLPDASRTIILANGRDITESKNAENALRIKTAFLSGLLISIPDMVFFKNQQGEYLGCNPEFAKLVNRDIPSIIGLTNYDLFPPEEADFYRMHDDRTMQAGCPCRNEEWVAYPDGRRVLLEMLKAPLKDVDGRIIGILGIGRDITDRKQVEEALLESENRYRGLFERSHDAITTVEPPTWKFTSANPATLRMYKASSLEEFLSFSPYDLSPEYQPDGRKSSEKSLEMIETALRDNYHCFEWTHKRIDGEEFLSMITLSRMTRGDKMFLQATIRDISESKEAERRLAQTRWNYETFFNRINDFLFVLDEEGNIIHANAKITYRLGYQEEELYGKSVLNIFPPECREEANRIVGKLLAGKDEVLTIPLMTKTGEQIPVETRISTGFWDCQPVLFGVSKDISQIKLSEELFSKAFHLNSVIMALSRLEDGVFIDVNETFLKAFGYSREEIIGFKASESGLFATTNQRNKIIEKLVRDGSVKDIEIAIRGKDGSVRDCLLSAETIRVGNDPCMLSVVIDVTNRKEMERRQALTTKVLAILNERSPLPKASGSILAAIQEAMDVDAVGIRLRNGDDYPYISQHGFSSEFLVWENSLLSHDAKTSVCRNDKGSLNLECICGQVILERFDPKDPLFTEGGSFWTNDSLKLLDLTKELDLRTQLRKRCIVEGFRSMAIIPIRTTEEIIGVLQINDRNKDCFTLDKIQYFESIASSIGVALERKHAEDALRESEEKLRNYVEHSFDVIFTLDEKGIVLFLSPAFERQFGIPVGEALGKSFMSFVHPDDIAPLAAYLDAVLDMEHSETSPAFRVKHADGGWRWIEANGTRYQDANGEMRFIGIGRNITDRKADEEQLRDYATALEANNKALEEFSRLTQEATRAKSVFLANMSHEIRTPMTAILGCADLLINEAEIESASPERRINLDTIKRNGEHLLGLINDILDLSKIEAGKMKIEITRCSPFRVIEEVLSLMRVRCAVKDLLLKADLSEPLPETISTDPLRLRQMLINLIGNAIKFTDIGEICVAARLAEDGKLLRIDVSDTGIGMNEEQVKMLFKAFAQVDNSATRKFSGTGLGLCISKRLAEAMGGRIDVCSKPGQGSTFSIFIDPGPLDDIRMIRHDELPKKEVTMAFPAANQIDLNHCKVLLAEDGPDNQRLICTVLKNAGAEVTAVENGQLAVENAMAARDSDSPFNVILMDMQMPVMDGYSATRELRRRGYVDPIIALTAHALSDDRKKCLDAGCDDFATKPINWVELLQMTAQWAKKSAAGESARKHVSQESFNMQETILRSTYADVPVLAGILPDFVGGLDARINAMKDALATENMEDLRRFAHQLKGAGGSYGYPSMSDAARLLETAVREGRVQDAESLLNKVVEVCQAAVRGFQEQPETSTP